MNLKKFDNDLKKEYEKINLNSFKNLKKNSSYNLPFNLKKNINPWAIGNNLYLALNKRYKVMTYIWTSTEKLFKKGDILIGYTYNPFTIFRRSVSNLWEREYLFNLSIQTLNK